MIIHFSILAVILLMSLVYERRIRVNKIAYGRSYAGPVLPWIVSLGYIAVLAGLRSGMNDTSVYRESFKNLPGTWQAIGNILSGDGKDKGFDILGNLFKMYVSDNYHMWFLAFAVIESALFLYIFRKYAYSYLIAMFYFFASTLYYNYFSMMRQWFAVALTFFGFKFIREGKLLPYIILCCLAAQIHSSAYIMITFYFIVRGKAWHSRQNLMILGFSAAMIFLNPLLHILENVMEGTTYDYVISAMQSNTGSSGIRILIAAVPVVIAFAGRKCVVDETMNICVNASLINLMLNILAAFTSGLFVIRLATYTSVYNVLLYPYLLEMTFNKKSKKIIKPLFFAFYFLFYIYQMIHQESFGYSSDILGYF